MAFRDSGKIEYFTQHNSLHRNRGIMPGCMFEMNLTSNPLIHYSTMRRATLLQILKILYLG